MMRTRCRFALAAALGCAVTVGAAPAAPAGSDGNALRSPIVTPTFARPDDSVAWVTVEDRDERGTEPPVSASLEYELALRRDGAGWIGAPRAFHTVVPGATPDAVPVRRALPFQLAAPAMREFRVAADGRFAGLVDPAGASGVLREALRGVAPGAPASGSAIDAATAPAALDAAAAAYWEPVVGRWVGRPLRLDAVETTTTGVPPVRIPGIGDVPATEELHVRRAPACVRSGQRRACVWIEIIRTPDPAALAQALERARAPTDAPRVAAVPADVQVTLSWSLLVEPDGLWPHEYEFERVVRFTAADVGAAEQRTRQRERRTYRYEPPAAAR